MRALLGALALLLVLPMGARGDGDWNDDDLPYTMATRVVSGDVLSDANLPLRLLDPDTGALVLSTATDGDEVGFGSGLQRGIQTNVLNGDFSLPPPDITQPISDSNPLPYWRYVDGGYAQRLIYAANSAYASGYVIQPLNTLVSGSGDSIYQFVDVPRSQGQQYRVLVSVYGANGGVTTNFLRTQFYAADKTTAIGSEVSSAFPQTSSELKIDAGLVPANAAYLRVSVAFDVVAVRPIGEVRVAFLPAEATVGLYSRSSTTGAISTTETSIAYALIPANSLVAGSQYVIKAFGTMTVTGGVARVATYNLRVGPTSLTGTIVEAINPTTTTNATGDGYMLEATLTVASVGASGTVYGSIEMNGGSQPFAVGSRVDVAGSTTTIDTTVANYIELTAETSNAAATTTFRQAYIQCVMAS